MKRLVLFLAILIAAVPASARKRDLKLLVFDPPRYPFVAVAENIQGEVNLRVTIGQSGKVQNVEVINGHPQLRESALDAARKMIFACEECSSENTFQRQISIRYEIKGRPTEDRQERARRAGSGIVLTTTPLPKETRTSR